MKFNLNIFKKCSQIPFHKAMKTVLDHKDDPQIKELVLHLLNNLVTKDDNLIDDIIVNIIKKRLYPVAKDNETGRSISV